MFGISPTGINNPVLNDIRYATVESSIHHMMLDSLRFRPSQKNHICRLRWMEKPTNWIDLSFTCSCPSMSTRSFTLQPQKKCSNSKNTSRQPVAVSHQTGEWIDVL